MNYINLEIGKNRSLQFLIDTGAGRDFFTKFLCEIDYETFAITLTVGNLEIIIPMKSWLNRNFCITVEKRSESIHPVNINGKEDSIILQNEIQPGIFISNTVVQGNVNCHVKILNTTDNDVTLENIDFETELLKNYTLMT